MSEILPIALTPKKTLLIGAGPVAAQKYKVLLDSKFDITILTKEIKNSLFYGSNIILGAIDIESKITSHTKPQGEISNLDSKKHNATLSMTSNQPLHNLDSILKGNVRRVSAEILNEFDLVIDASGDASLGQFLSANKRRFGYLLNVVDVPQLCDFYFGAIVRQDSVAIMVSTNGSSPILAQSLRDKIANMLPKTLGKFATFLGQMRKGTQARHDLALRSEVSKNMESASANINTSPNASHKSLSHDELNLQNLDSKESTQNTESKMQDSKKESRHGLAFRRKGEVSKNIESANANIDTSGFALSMTTPPQNLDSKTPKKPAPMSEEKKEKIRQMCKENLGKVFIIGCGPGSFANLTLKAYETLPLLDVALIDNLVSPQIWEYLHTLGIECISVGKQKGKKSYKQSAINTLMADLARQGKCVGRLKGGDPVIFGRVWEEASFLQAKGIDVECISAISSSLCGALTSGIVPTLRGVSAGVLIVSAHLRESVFHAQWLEWLKGSPYTLIVMMAYSFAARIVDEARVREIDLSIPAAFVSRVGSPAQKSVIGTLGTLEAMAQYCDKPAILIIGKAVSYADSMPFTGERVIITKDSIKHTTLKQHLA